MAIDHNYTEDKIETLSSLEHIRARPGMYIGRMGNGTHPDDGIYVLFKEVVDNSVDEYIMGFGRKIDIALNESQVAIRDYGRGIPLGKIVECVSVINTGGKFNDDVFQFSVGLNGVGIKAVNALSEQFTVTSFREGKFFMAKFSEGIVLGTEKGKTEEKDGTEIVFIPSRTMFHKYVFDMDYVKKRLWMYAYLNSGLSLYFNNERFYSENGLKDLIESEVGEESLYNVFHFKNQSLEFSFCHTSNYGENHYSFVNGQYTNDGGTHLSAFKEGLLKGINEFSNKSFQGSDVRDGMVGAIAIKLKEPIFESQTKNKLGNNDIKGWVVSAVKDAIVDFLHKNPQEAETILEKVSHNERIRKEIQAVKKDSKEKAKRMALKIPKLKDCKYHLDDNSQQGKESMIFLTEGQSAAGSMISCRDVYTQAIYSIRGKPLNCFGESFDNVYKNEEFYYIMQCLNVEDDIDNLRYEKVVIATDSDVDGLHIRNLLITFFLTYFEQLVLSGHLYILETPLFRVRNKKEIVYCYDEEERDKTVEKLGEKGVEVTRFKGLGEISPSEFEQFIGKDIRLINVNVDYMRDIPVFWSFIWVRILRREGTI